MEEELDSVQEKLNTSIVKVNILINIRLAIIILKYMDCFKLGRGINDINKVICNVSVSKLLAALIDGSLNTRFIIFYRYELIIIAR